MTFVIVEGAAPVDEGLPELPSDATAAEIAAAKAGSPAGGEWGVYVGPEGDFTPDELAALCKVAVPTDFGPAILRAETAALFALSVLKGMLEADAPGAAS